MVNSGNRVGFNNNLNNNFNHRQIDRMLPTSQVTRRDNLRQNFDALHSNYKTGANDAASIHAGTRKRLPGAPVTRPAATP